VTIEFGIPIAIAIALVLFLSIGVPWEIRLERRVWNGWRCRAHGRPWIHFDTDSQGGRGYACRHPTTPCGTWISYRRVDATREAPRG